MRSPSVICQSLLPRAWAGLRSTGTTRRKVSASWIQFSSVRRRVRCLVGIVLFAARPANEFLDTLQADDDFFHVVDVRFVNFVWQDFTVVVNKLGQVVEQFRGFFAKIDVLPKYGSVVVGARCKLVVHDLCLSGWVGWRCAARCLDF